MDCGEMNKKLAAVSVGHFYSLEKHQLKTTVTFALFFLNIERPLKHRWIENFIQELRIYKAIFLQL